MSWAKSSPSYREDEEGNLYFLESTKSNYKRKLKKQSNRKLRRSGLDEVGSNAKYKKYYDLWWILY